MSRLLERYGSSYQDFPRIPSEDVRILWEWGRRDGPTAGLALYRERRCWFEMMADWVIRDGDYYRDYLVVRLSDEQLEDALHWHDLFIEKVGNTIDYDESGRRIRPPTIPHPEIKGLSINLALKSLESQQEFHELSKQRKEPDYSLNPILGWFGVDFGSVAEYEEEGGRDVP